MGLKSRLKGLRKQASTSFENAKSKLTDSIDDEIKRRAEQFGKRENALEKSEANAYEFPFGVTAYPHIKIAAIKTEAIVQQKDKDTGEKITTYVDVVDSLMKLIFLPMPEGGISDQVSNSWNTETVGPISGALLDAAMDASTAAQEGQTFLESTTNALEASYNSIQASNKDGRLGNNVKTAMVLNAAKAAGSGIGGNVVGAYQRRTGLSINPNEAVLFDKTNFRSFTFNYKFMPRNEKESIELHKIIRYLKRYSLPTKLTDGDIFLKIPHKFKVFFSENKYLPIIKTCVLTDISTTYNESNNIYHAGGHPNEIKLGLTFKEIEVQTSADY